MVWYVYINYWKYKNKALKESEIIRKQFSWENAAEIAYKILDAIHKGGKKTSRRERYKEYETQQIKNKNQNFFGGALSDSINIDFTSDHKYSTVSYNILISWKEKSCLIFLGDGTLLIISINSSSTLGLSIIYLFRVWTYNAISSPLGILSSLLAILLIFKLTPFLFLF